MFDQTCNGGVDQTKVTLFMVLLIANRNVYVDYQLVMNENNWWLILQVLP